MIITAGKYKGRKLKTPKTYDVRPTSSKVRESIFNMVQLTEAGTIFYEGETMFLDLFAGSGVMGLEALSRGAKKVVFVEKNPEAVKILQLNISVISDKDNIKLIRENSLKILAKFRENEFNFIFADPPYEAGLYEPVLKTIAENSILAKNGFIVLEHAREAQITDLSSRYNFNVFKTKIYGDTGITIIIPA